MKNLIRLKKSRAVRLTASAVAVAAAVVGATGIVAGQGNAAPAIKAEKASLSSKKSGFKHPKLKHGVLTIKGTEASDKIALRLQAGNPAILQVDVGDDGSADFSFERNEIAKIAVDARPGEVLEDFEGIVVLKDDGALAARERRINFIAKPDHLLLS